ncbi:MAG: helix-turn-helix transcriptional regulator [Thermoleophilia bacterium]|nr:helix-turn-helix transcriptional regulator [Thermoleophilia bacterium]
MSYQARARLADNLLVRRRRAGLSQGELSERALVFRGRIARIENGNVTAQLDTYVRLAGALSITLDELLAGVTWRPGVIHSEIKAGYEVEFEVENPIDR